MVHPRPSESRMEYDFHTVDVFTDRIFGGNPLGVFPDARGMSDATMQRVAREMNLSETVFLLPPETPDGTRRVRIFTPAQEVPFAGHPTVGSAYFLAETGAVELGPEGGTLVLEENVGPVPVSVEMEGGRPARTVLTAAVPPEYRPVEWSPEEVAAMISLEVDDLAGADRHEQGGGAPGSDGAAEAPGETGAGISLEPEWVSCGLPYLVVPVADIDAARRSALELTTWQRLTADAWNRFVYVVALEGEGEGVDVHVRMYAPSAGVPEDPATGSAAAALGGYLGKRVGCRHGDGTYRWRVEQGLEMGRPSLLDVEADVVDGEVEAVRVGGRSVLVSRGTMEVPEAAS